MSSGNAMFYIVFVVNNLVGVKTCVDHSANSNPQGDPNDRTVFVGMTFFYNYNFQISKTSINIQNVNYICC